MVKHIQFKITKNQTYSAKIYTRIYNKDLIERFLHLICVIVHHNLIRHNFLNDDDWYKSNLISNRHLHHKTLEIISDFRYAIALHRARHPLITRFSVNTAFNAHFQIHTEHTRQIVVKRSVGHTSEDWMNVGLEINVPLIWSGPGHLMCHLNCHHADILLLRRL